MLECWATFFDMYNSVLFYKNKSHMAYGIFSYVKDVKKGDFFILWIILKEIINLGNDNLASNLIQICT